MTYGKLSHKTSRKEKESPEFVWGLRPTHFVQWNTYWDHSLMDSILRTIPLSDISLTGTVSIRKWGSSTSVWSLRSSGPLDLDFFFFTCNTTHLIVLNLLTQCRHVVTLTSSNSPVTPCNRFQGCRRLSSPTWAPTNVWYKSVYQTLMKPCPLKPDSLSRSQFLETHLGYTWAPQSGKVRPELVYIRQN
jgi:hypothetical protein